MRESEKSPVGRGRTLAWLGLSACAVAVGFGGLSASPEASDRKTLFYSTAAPPADYPGPVPIVVALVDIPGSAAGVSTPEGKKVDGPAEGGTARLASAAVPTPAESSRPDRAPRPSKPPARAGSALAPKPDPIAEAKRIIAGCKSKYRGVRDYTCMFFKRERLDDGQMTGQHVMLMKARTAPRSVYFKFQRPNSGREVIWVADRNGGRALAHDVGLGKLLAGTVHLEPRSRMAMEGCRHPITDAGLGHMIDEIATRWAAEMKHGETVVTIQPNARVGDRRCTMIESKHPDYHQSYLFHKVKVYVDHEHDLPIRFEAYDWPRAAGAPAELVEEYSYVDLRLNVGLSDHDFDPGNRAYSFGRF